MTQLLRRDVWGAIPGPELALTRAIEAAARKQGLGVYLVGGPVRDLLLGRNPRDVDLMLVGLPPDCAVLAAFAGRALPEASRIVGHERFGTVTVEVGGVVMDLAAARRESYARPGALPRVEIGTLEEDLQRRDFSVNALAILLTGGNGEDDERLAVIDRHEGIVDLEQQRLVTLHRESFRDDPTRSLRAARLAARLGFSLSRATRSDLRDAIRAGAFGAVSGDRLRREFEKMFEDAREELEPAAALRLLSDWDVLPALEPGLALFREALVPLRRLGRSLRTPPWRGTRVRPLFAGLALWLAPLPQALRHRALQRFSIRGEWQRRVASFPRDRDTWTKALEGVRGRGAVDAVLSGVDEERLFALHASAAPPIRRRILRWAAEDRHRRIPISGADLVAVGLEGPAVGTALAKIRAAVLDGAVANREEATALAREIARRRGPGARRARTRRPS